MQRCKSRQSIPDLLDRKLSSCDLPRLQTSNLQPWLAPEILPAHLWLLTVFEKKISYQHFKVRNVPIKSEERTTLWSQQSAGSKGPAWVGHAHACARLTPFSYTDCLVAVGTVEIRGLCLLTSGK